MFAVRVKNAGKDSFMVSECTLPEAVEQVELPQDVLTRYPMAMLHIDELVSLSDTEEYRKTLFALWSSVLGGNAGALEMVGEFEFHREQTVGPFCGKHFICWIAEASRLGNEAAEKVIRHVIKCPGALTDKEMESFAESVRSRLRPDDRKFRSQQTYGTFDCEKEPEKVITSALISAIHGRYEGTCGFAQSHSFKRDARRMRYHFADWEMRDILAFCDDETVAHTVQSAAGRLGPETVAKLNYLLPTIYHTRKKRPDEK